MTDEIRVSLDDIRAAATAALSAHGADEAHASATGDSIAAAEAEGLRAVGLAHLPDYCAGLAAGRANGAAAPVIAADGAVIRIDAREGMPHLAFRRALPLLRETAKDQGVAILALRNGFTAGALSWYAWPLAEAGLAALVAANAAPAVMPASGGRRRMFCTNPMAFAMPRAGGDPVLFDQSSSEVAFVKIRMAAEAGESIPEGWAVGPDGAPTTDPARAMQGALLPFGGARGANIALMVELMAAALTGANFSHAAPAFNEGDRSPGVGLFILAIDPARSGGAAAPDRVAALADALLEEPGVYLPGPARAARARAVAAEGVEIPVNLWEATRALAAPR